ncbi:fibronectin type III domain-containing protein [Streptomyces sp. NPDC021080]|uniref:fibronectin type III domain-containing protein n=1 Tax=Streptomyces sp. NPDC021080 TaxID=3365110 RepID=UPI00379A0EE8
MAASDQSSTYETDGAIGTKGAPVPAPVPVSQPDTSNVGLVNSNGWAPVNTGISATRETTVGTVVLVDPGYKAAPAPVPGAIKDTTWTDSPVGNGTAPTTLNAALAISGTLETGSIGAVAAGSSAMPVAPVAPTAAAGDRYVLVTFTPVADPHATAPVTQYVIESDTGGHVYAPRGATTVRFENLKGGQAYKFRVAAVNKNGDGPFGPFSSVAVAPGNEDEVRPGGLSVRNTVNPIYRADGTIKQGSYGAPTPPGKPTVAAGATTTANVTWAAPSTGQPSGGYDVKSSTGQTVHAAPSATTINVPGLTLTNVVTFTVTAIGQLQNAVSPASNNYTVV